MAFPRKMLRISRKEKKSNEPVLREHTTRTLINRTLKYRANFWERVMSTEKLEHLVTT